MTLAEQLTQAQAAYHRLQIGESAVRFTDQNGETVEYTRASAPGWRHTSSTCNARSPGSPGLPRCTSQPRKV